MKIIEELNMADVNVVFGVLSTLDLPIYIDEGGCVANMVDSNDNVVARFTMDEDHSFSKFLDQLVILGEDSKLTLPSSVSGLKVSVTICNMLDEIKITLGRIIKLGIIDDIDIVEEVQIADIQSHIKESGVMFNILADSDTREVPLPNNRVLVVMDGVDAICYNSTIKIGGASDETEVFKIYKYTSINEKP